MTLLAQKILLVLVDTASQAGADGAPSFDTVAATGCTGFLRVSEAERSDLEILLGVQRGVEGYSLAYPKMPVALFSSSENALEAAKAAGVASTKLIAAGSDGEEARNEVLALLVAEQSKQLVVVHVDHAVTKNHWVDKLVGELLPQREADGSGKVFIAVVRRALQRSTPDVPHPLRPRQSYEKRDGKYAEESTNARRLLLAYVHHDHTRRDASERFDAEHVDEVGGGGYGTMGAHVFIKEIAFRLGFAPKYGA